MVMGLFLLIREKFFFKKINNDSSSLLDRLNLTISNKRSLVFWVPPNDSRPGVLFTADSDLHGVKIPEDIDKAIVTAPHHGSEANKNVYDLFKDKKRMLFGSVVMEVSNPDPDIHMFPLTG